MARDRTESSERSKILYIVKSVAVKINVAKLANWIDIDKNSYGKFTLIAKGAKTISINFSDFLLPPGAEMYIYNKDGEMITGLITEAENNKTGMWGSSIYRGQEVNIEIKIPLASRDKLSLNITNVAYGYKEIFVDKVAGFGQSGACNINVLCAPGIPWLQKETQLYI